MIIFKLLFSLHDQVGFLKVIASNHFDGDFEFPSNMTTSISLHLLQDKHRESHLVEPTLDKKGFTDAIKLLKGLSLLWS